MSFCNKCRPQIKKFMRYIDKQLLININIGLQVAAKLKQALDSKVMITLTELTPTNLDNYYRQKVSELLRILLVKFGYQNITQIFTDDALNAEKKDAILIKIASQVTKQLDNRYTDNIYDTAVQMQYTLNKNVV